MFSKKAKKIDEIFTVDLTLCSKCQIVGEDFVKFCGLLREPKLYEPIYIIFNTYIHIFRLIVSSTVALVEFK